MSDKNAQLAKFSKSGFVRSVITRVLAIFVVVSIIIAVTAFFSFTSDIRKTILSDKQRQLSIVERTISERMAEITSVSYNIGKDSAFFLEPVDDNPNSGREMSEMLARYRVGNSFIEHLAYCRSAEPDKIYISTGERSLSEFFTTDFGMDANATDWIIQQIHKENKTSVRTFGEGDNAYFSYSYPLPQLASKPQAHVLMMIPVKEVKPLFETLYINEYGAAAVFDNDGTEIFSTSSLDDEIDLLDFVKSGTDEEDYRSPSGQRYVLQKVVSKANSWTYVSVLRHCDTLSGLANTQIAFIVFILLMLVVAIIFMLLIIISQYKPISKLVEQVADVKQDENSDNITIDERTLLSDTIATLKDDREQKQKYETAFLEAEAANKAKSAFLSSMSHDIRTPMNAIIGMTSIARKHIGDQDYVDECLKKVQVSSDYLLDIINNVLDMSRIESGRIPIAEEPVVIPALIDSLVSLMTSSVEAKSQKLHVDIGKLKHTTVLGDNIHIIQVFVNILSNAAKFTPEGGNIYLKVRQIESDDINAGDYVFSFSDTGIGIPPEFINQVFETFTRVGGHVASETEGTGLGMAIAKRLVELMNGTIKCESELGHGATFTVTMHMKYTDENYTSSMTAVSSQSHTSHESAELTAPDLTGKRILLAEDNAMNREIAKHIILETGAEIIEANDGKAAVDAFANHTAGYFDLIFMDIQMPVMNGYEATAAIRTMDRPDAETVPIYAMTANTFDEDVRQVKDAGMNGHIGKPYNPQMVFSILKHAIGVMQVF